MGEVRERRGGVSGGILSEREIEEEKEGEGRGGEVREGEKGKEVKRRERVDTSEVSKGLAPRWSPSVWNRLG